MKKLFAIFTAVILMPASQTLAWTGGPFSNNNPLSTGDDGIWEAVATMSNGVGLYRFAVRNNGTSANTAPAGAVAALESSNVQFGGGLLGAQSSNVWYYKGITYYGVCFGMANSDAQIVSAVAYATSNTQGAQQGGGVAPNAAGVNGIINPGPSGNNIGYANSSFIAKMRDKGPAFRFNGTGQISFVGNADQVSRIEAINPFGATVTNRDLGPGTITPINGISAGNSQTVTSTNVASTVTSPGGGTFNLTRDEDTAETSFTGEVRQSQGGEDGSFSQRGHLRTFVVFGSKVSHSVFP